MIVTNAGQADRLLVRAIGVRALAASIVNYTVGSGIFALPSLAAMQLGAAAPLAYVVCAVIMALMVLCFAEAGSRVAVSGGPYAYVTVAMGPFLGFIGGVLLAIAVLAAAAVVTTLFAASAVRLVGAPPGTLEPALIVGVLAVAAWLNIRGVDTGARLVEVMSLAKLVPIVAFVIGGAFFVRPENLAVAATPDASAVLGTAGILVFAFFGIEGALQPSGEVKNPSRTVPLAAFLAIAAVVLLYLAVQIVAQGILGGALASSGVTPLADAAAVVAGTPGRVFILAGASVSMLGYLCGAALGVPRLVFALARDGYLPQWLVAVHPTHHTPHRAILVYTLLVAILALTGTFTRLLILANIVGLLLYAQCTVAAWLVRRRDIRGDGEPFAAPGGAWVPWVACAAIAWVIAETGTRVEAIGATLLLLVASAAYAARAWIRRG